MVCPRGKAEELMKRQKVEDEKVESLGKGKLSAELSAKIAALKVERV